MQTREKIISLMKRKGLVIPSQISKEIGSNILMASAILSELSSKGAVKISSLKIGGTPLYYLPGQEEKLQKFSDNLNDKQKKAFELLKERKILREKDLEPVTRVALRDIKDFAYPLQVTRNNEKEIFWKWYLLSSEEASKLIKEYFIIPKEETTEEKKEPKEETKTEKQIALSQKEPQKEEKKAPEIKQPDLKKEKTVQSKIISPKESEAKEEKKETSDTFFKKIETYLTQNKVEIISWEILRKNSEIDLIIEIPSTLGSLKYYCKAKNKKKISDNDISSAYAIGQLKKYPVLFLTKGDLTKKAKEMLENDFKNIKYKKMN